MKKNLFKKTYVLAIITLIVGFSFFPSISGFYSMKTNNNVRSFSECSDTIPITFYTFDKKSSNKNCIDLPNDAALEITSIIDQLKIKIVNEPFSEETKSLKIEFVELLDIYELLPNDMSKNDVISLLNPSWLRLFGVVPELRTKSTIFSGFNNIFDRWGNLHRFFLDTEIIDILETMPDQALKSAALFLCSVGSGGNGLPIPLFLLPRPRCFLLWSGSEKSGTGVGSLLSGRGFIAGGPQTGFSLGFLGVGLTYSFLGATVYALIGYSLFTFVNANEIAWVAPENVRPEISDESPGNGAKDVSTSLSELRFRIFDVEGDRMDYYVSTDPNIGSGNGNFKKNGFYTIPVSGLKSDTKYTWNVVVNDQYKTTEKTFSFTTEVSAPVVSDPIPINGDSWVDVDLSDISFNLKDFQGDTMDFTVETSPNIGSGSGSNIPDGNYKVHVDDLVGDTDYTWFVNVTDGIYWTREVFNFRTQPIMEFDPFDEGWQYRKKVTIDSDMIEGDLSDFPVLVSITDDDLRDKAQSDGDDILFMDDVGIANMLFHENENFESSDGELVAWVRIPDLDSSSNNIFYLYYGNPTCGSQEIPEYVWDQDYIHVWHLGSSLEDSAGTDDGINHGTSLVSGRIGYARDFENNEQDYITFGDMAQPGDGSLTTMTWEGWVKPETKDGVIMCKYDTQGPDDNSYIISFRDNGFFKSSAIEYFGGGHTSAITDEPCSEPGEWVYLTSTFDLGGDNFVDQYVNGEDVASTELSNSGDFMRDISVSDDLGRYRPEAGTQYTDSVIDEVRWSKIIRSDAWIKTSFNTMYDPSGFMDFGSEETGP